MMDSDKSYQREKDRRYAEMYWHAPKAEHLQQLRDDSRPPNDPVQFVESVVRLIERRKEEDNNDTPFHIVVPRCYKELMDAKYPMLGLDLTVKDRLMEMNGTVSVRVGRDVNHIWLCSARKLSERNSTTEQEPMFVLSQSDKEKFKELWRKHIEACTAENIYNTSKDREQKYFIGAGRAFTAEEIQQLKEYEQTLETELKKLYEEKNNRKWGICTVSGKDRTAVTINFNGAVVGPEDKIVLTLDPDVDPKNVKVDDIKQAFTDVGIDPSRVLILYGVSASTVKPQAEIAGLPFPGEHWESAVVTEYKVNDQGGWGKNWAEAEKAMRPLTEYDDSKPVIKVEKNDGPTNITMMPNKEWIGQSCSGKFIGNFKPVSIEGMEEVARQSVGKPFLDSDGKVLGTVERAWVENGQVMSSVAWGKMPEQTDIINDLHAKANKKVTEHVELVTLDQTTDIKVQSYDPETGSITVGTDTTVEKVTTACEDEDTEEHIMTEEECKQFKERLESLPKKVKTVEPMRKCGYCNGTGHKTVCRVTKPCPVCGGKGSR
jgi:hypothetical protein